MRSCARTIFIFCTRIPFGVAGVRLQQANERQSLFLQGEVSALTEPYDCLAPPDSPDTAMHALFLDLLFFI